MAHDAKALRKWRRSQDASPRRRALSPDELEVAVMRISETFPGHVIRGAA